ncbi:threonine--tRNA ligase [Candidatus Kaiserbacteria bacterium RIFCSPHIGHO2_01_FULL_50_13]|nr:MAG: threonine--tRNA ligase [Candidatus Kaiserbacteria bacterium RIFCSPHIGHO2_01_FULL_50_13]OGG82023.1 MAG: threonine--tRNA ligase [Candidatus Kaiserbacteria bacterium RIFCSPLOWO2_02_FULL_51_13]
MAELRDHKQLGRELDLFVFSDLVGSGLPLWTPKGTLIRNLLDDFVWELRQRYGYEKVEIPHITRKELYEVSGHWNKFQDDLFRIQTREKHEFALKPMNCPHHAQIYARKPWSYRELPQRYANSTMCYRDEHTGELNGLARVRALTIDDAHTFCRETQVKEEFLKIWNIVETFYGAFGFTDLTIRLSFHNSEEPGKYLGDKKKWERAEKILREIAKEKGAKTIDGVGEAAFYGPKLDFMTHDSQGREWQVATIQLDLNMPERFDLTCVNEQGEKERIVMIHAAVMGSIERFLSIIIEHTQGNFPLWLTPVQTLVLPISEKHVAYAVDVCTQLNAAGIRAEIDTSNETLGKKVRNGKMQKIPYLLVVGDKEVESGIVAVEHHQKGKSGALKIADLIEKLREEIKTRT